jgi:DNA-binding MarR family transcriptional regulator
MSTASESPLAKAGVKPPRELVSSPSFLLKRLGFAVKERVSDAFEDAGASAYHYAVLAVLEEGDRETQATIADALTYDRSYLVRVTPAGRKSLARLRALQGRVDDEFFAPLSTDERATLHALLHKLAVFHDPRYGSNGHD